MFEPDFRILHFAQKTKSVQRFTQERAALLGIRLIRLRLFTKLPQPLHKGGKLVIQNSLQIFLQER